MITTQKSLREYFWETDGKQFVLDYRKSYKQNDYSATVRCTWVDFVDGMRKAGRISEALAQRATL